MIAASFPVRCGVTTCHSLTRELAPCAAHERRTHARQSRTRCIARTSRADDRGDERRRAAAGDVATMSKVVKTAQEIAVTAARIFGHHIGNGLPSGRKVLRKRLIGPTLAAYYPESIAKLDALMVDPNETRRVIKLERLKRRGKGPPKKGEGKRASKGK
jgi:small subunit ribosomal protein S33